MKSCEGVGKSIEKAIENALLELKAPREDVDIKILEEGGLFKKAKVLVTISDDCIEKYEKREQRKQNQEPRDEEILDVKAFFKNVEKLRKESETENEIEKEIEKPIKREKKTEKISGVQFVKNLLEVLGTNYELFCEEDNEKVVVKIEGGNSGDLIGYRGECLNAIQYIASVVENEFSGRRKKFILDIENYKVKREETLKALAERMESKVEKTGKPMKLEPMNANERRIIHTYLQKSETVTTMSKGTEPNRYVVILPKTNKENEE